MQQLATYLPLPSRIFLSGAPPSTLLHATLCENSHSSGPTELPWHGESLKLSGAARRGPKLQQATLAKVWTIKKAQANHDTEFIVI